MLKKMLVSILFASVAVLAEWSGALVEPSSKKLDDKDFYVINSPENLAWFADKVNDGSTSINAILGKDISFGTSQESYSSNDWTPIGKDSSHIFNGILDGNGFAIYGMSQYRNKNVVKDQYAGLVGVLGSSGAVKNLSIQNSRFWGSYNGAAVAVNHGLVENVKNYSLVMSNSVAGGIVGLNYGNVIRCFNGGGVALASHSSLYSSYTTENIGGTSSTTIYVKYNYKVRAFAGGVVGFNQGLVQQSENRGALGSDSTSAQNAVKLAAPVLYAAKLCAQSIWNYTTFFGGVVGGNKGTVSSVRSAGAYNIEADYDKSTEGSCSQSFYFYKHYLGGIIGYNDAEGELNGALGIQDSSGYGVAYLNEGSNNTVFYDNALASTSFKTNEGTAKNLNGMTTATLKQDSIAWLLNTLYETTANSGVWSRNGDYPILSDENNYPICKIWFVDNGKDVGAFLTNNAGRLSDWPTVSAEEGKVFEGWYNRNGDKVVLKYERFSTDDTLTAKYVLPEEATYSVLFFNADTLFKKFEVPQGTVASFEGTNPVRDTSIYAYEFKGWTPEFDAVTEDETRYDAVYDSSLIEFTVHFYQNLVEKNWQLFVKDVKVPYGHAATEPELTEYSFCVHTEWDQDFSYVTKNMLVQINCVPACTVSYYIADTLYAENRQACDAPVEWPATPEADGKVFLGWDYAADSIVSDTVIHANFADECLVTFNVLDELYSEQVIACGTAATDPGIPPIDGYEASWNKKFDNVTSDLIVEAVYNKIYYVEKFNANCYSSFDQQTSTTYTLVKWPGGVVSTQKVSYWSYDVEGNLTAGATGAPGETIKLSADTTRIFAHMSSPATVSSNCSIFLQNHNSDGSLKGSEEESSSSEGSGDVESSSSEAESESSSSSVDPESSSADAILNHFAQVNFGIEVQGRQLMIYGVKAGDKIALMDVQGRIVLKAEASSSDRLVMEVPITGTCILQAGKNRQVISIK